MLSASAVDGNTARAEGRKSAYGGGVDTDGTLTASDGASISRNTAVSLNGDANGGGLQIGPGGTAVLSASAVDGNTARTEGSRLAAAGGVYTDGTLTASDGASISSNTAVSLNGEAQGGGLEIGEGGTAVLSASNVEGNTARAEGSKDAYGGGVVTKNSLTVIDGASISNNTAVSLNGQAYGGGVVAADSSGKCAAAVALNDSSVLNNTARAERGAHAEGGGLATFCSLTARNATIVGNRALAANGICRGGGLFHAGFPALLHGGVIDSNAAIGRVASGSQVLVGAPIAYVLPAPLGRWLDGVRQCNRAMCPAGIQGGEVECALQPCDFDVFGDEVESQWIAVALPGPADGDAYPPRCIPGSYAAGADPEADLRVRVRVRVMKRALFHLMTHAIRIART